MYHRIILSIVFLSIIVLCFAQYGPAIPLNDIPPCYAFNAKDGVQVNDAGTLYFVYRQKVADYQDKIILASPDWQGNCTFHILETLHYNFQYNYEKLRGAPSLCLTENQITVAYNHGDVVKQAVSTDNGVTWTVSVIDQARDTMPIIQTDVDGNLTAFITSLDEMNQPGSSLFSNNDFSTDDTPVTYWGTDIIHSTVRSNTDIWISQAGGGSNQGWPTFYAPVITSGIIRAFPGSPPYEMVFRAGYYEHVPPLSLNTDLMRSQLLQNVWNIGYTEPHPDVITFVTVNGTDFSYMLGHIIQNGWDTLSVYSDYPPGNGDVLFLNIIPHIDTVWTNGGGGYAPTRTCVVRTPLWIRGIFSGKQNWYSPYDITLVDDIRLESVPLGEEIPENCEDYVALVSDKKILIQYGYRDPCDSLRYKPNCGSDADGISIYASLYGLSEGESAIPQDDGCFTFEYQHPHPSVPAYNLDGSVYDNIDLHRYQYPQTTTDPWPSEIDFPWYNPLYPESAPTMQRGTAHLYGAVYQQRRGYLSRNVLDGEYPNTGNIWNIDLDYCGGQSGVAVTDDVLDVTYTPANAPGAFGGGVGYKKDFHADPRLKSDTFDFNPFGFGIHLMNESAGVWSTDYYKSLSDSLYSKSFQPNLLQFNNRIFYRTESDLPFTEYSPPLAANETIEAYGLNMEVFQDNTAQPDSFKVMQYLPENNQLDCLYKTSTAGKLNCGIRNFYTPCAMSLQPNGQFKLEYLYDNSPIPSFWNPEIPVLADNQVDLNKSKLTAIKTGYAIAQVMMFLAYPDSTGGQLYYGIAPITEVANEDNIVPPLQVTTRTYPNPFNQSLTLQVKTNQSVKADISIYNIKGQKVRTLATDYLLSKGSQDFTWDGLDSDGNPTASGIYFLRSDIAGKATLTKLLKIK